MASFVLAGGHLVSGILLVTFNNIQDWDEVEYSGVYETIKLIKYTRIASGVSVLLSQ